MRRMPRGRAPGAGATPVRVTVEITVNCRTTGVWTALPTLDARSTLTASGSRGHAGPMADTPESRKPRLLGAFCHVAWGDIPGSNR